MTPSWQALIGRLIRDRPSAIQTTYSARQITKLLAKLNSQYGELFLASVVRQTIDDEYAALPEDGKLSIMQNKVRSYLYGNWIPGGPQAASIVRLLIFLKALGRTATVITTNYDSNLEDAGGDSSIAKVLLRQKLSIQPVVDSSRVPRNAIPVYHVHGYVPNVGAPLGDLVLSESGIAFGEEYQGATPKPAWRNRLMKSRLEDSAVLFVGTSLRDPNLVRLLAETRNSTQPRYAILPKQGDASVAWPIEQQKYVDEILQKRLEHLRVHLIRPDFFGQVAQFFNEVTLCALTPGSTYAGSKPTVRRYGQRLAEWWDDWVGGVKPFSASYQQRTHTLLSAIETVVRRSWTVPKGEQLKVELWVRRSPKTSRQLEVFGSSEVVYARARRRHRSEIDHLSDYAAVRAFCQGFVVHSNLAQGSPRWKSHLSLPIILRGPRWNYLPVGVITVLSSQKKGKSSLRSFTRSSAGAQPLRALTSAGVAVLSPP